MSARRARGVLTGAMVLSFVTALYFSRGTTFSGDEMTWIITSVHFDLATLLTPHGGHLQFVPRVVYKALLELSGLDYLPFRILTAAMICVTVGLLFKYLASRIPPVVALAPCLVLLFFGSDPLHALQGNGFTVLLAMSMGLLALIAFERNSRLGDVVASAALVVGIATYSVALPFVLAIAVAAAARREIRSRIWVAAVPAVLYVAWLVWAKSTDAGGVGSSADFTNLLLIPAWSFQALAAVGSALSGVSFDFSEGSSGLASSLGAPIAVGILVLTAILVHRNGISIKLLTVIVAALGLWSMQALVSHGGGLEISARLPDDARYMYPGAIVVVMVLAEAARNVNWSNLTVAIVAVVALAGLGTNFYLLREAGTDLRAQAASFHRGAAIYDLMARIVGTEDPPKQKRYDPQVLAVTPGTVLIGMLDLPYGKYEHPTLSPEGLTEEEKQTVDRAIAVELEASAGSIQPLPSTCRWAPSQGGTSRVEIPFGSSTIISSADTELKAGRLASQAVVDLFHARANEPVTVKVSGSQTVESPWYIEASDSQLAVC
jgi:hypothetical protein